MSIDVTLYKRIDLLLRACRTSVARFQLSTKSWHFRVSIGLIDSGQRKFPFAMRCISSQSDCVPILNRNAHAPSQWSIDKRRTTVMKAKTAKPAAKKAKAPAKKAAKKKK
jgi:hypothetical protein